MINITLKFFSRSLTFKDYLFFSILLSSIWNFSFCDIKINKFFKTTKDLQRSKNLYPGIFVRTKGYRTVEDGGASLYKIVNTTGHLEREYILPISGSTYFAKLILENNTANVKQFGAKGDGKLNDTPFIANAIRRLNGIDNATLYFPKGNYKIESSNKKEAIFYLYKMNNLTIRGEDSKLSTIIGYSHGNHFGRLLFFIDSCSRFRLKDLTFRGENQLNAALDKSFNFGSHFNSHTALFSSGTMNNMTIENCYFKYFLSAGLWLKHSGKNLLINNCKFLDGIRNVTGNGKSQGQPTGVLINNKVKNIEIKNCNFRDIIDTNKIGKKSHAIYLANVKDVHVHKNTFKMNKRYSFATNWSGGFQVYSGFSDNIIVEYNLFDNVTNNIASSSNVTFQNNKLINSRVNILFKAHKASVTNNKFKLTKTIYSRGLICTDGKVDDILIKDNNLYDYNKKPIFSYGIHLSSNTKRAIIHQNKVSGFYAGIYLGNSNNPKTIQNCLIKKNIFLLNKKSAYGIDIRSCESSSFIGNIAIRKSKHTTRLATLLSNEHQIGIIKNNVFKNNKVKGKNIILGVSNQ